MSQAERNKREFGWVDPNTVFGISKEDAEQLKSAVLGVGLAIPYVPPDRHYEDPDLTVLAEGEDESPGEVFVAEGTGSFTISTSANQITSLVDKLKTSLDRSIANVKALAKHK
jgi:hypothetical protein